MPEPDWMTELRREVDLWVPGNYVTKLAALERFARHAQAAYQRGLMAGRSQTGYTTRRKPKGGEEKHELD